MSRLRNPTAHAKAMENYARKPLPTQVAIPDVERLDREQANQERMKQVIASLKANKLS